MTRSDRADRLWAVVLAGGEGVRLRSLVRRVCGEERPKQYVPLLGERTLLCQTLDRVALLVPPSHTVVSTVRRHARYFAEFVANPQAPRVLVQPVDRGTAAGILLPAYWILRQDPRATMAVFPSDHFVRPESLFMAHVARVAEWAQAHPDYLIVLGAPATDAEVEYGWIETGRPLDTTGDQQIWQIRRFWEKPSAQQAQDCLASGCLWNTFVLVGSTAAFVHAAREAVPDVNERFTGLTSFMGTSEETSAIQQAYALMPYANFSRSILEGCPPFLAVSILPHVMWSDLGTPSRVFEVLKHVHDVPPWVLASDLVAAESPTEQ